MGFPWSCSLIGSLSACGSYVPERAVHGLADQRHVVLHEDAVVQHRGARR